ncbi:MAG: hypothetical protein P1U89_05265 [Verrucomicrobiales bacterium]|nr:hypothetical protein [Verrucomicrobiales bacterium]
MKKTNSQGNKTWLCLTAIFSLTLAPLSGSLAGGLEDVIRAYTNRGWLIHDIESDFLREGESTSMFVSISQGDDIVVRGEGAICIRDLDIAIYLPNGRLLKRDQDRDATPYITFRAPVSGRYRIQLKNYRMHSGCSEAEAAVILAER